MNNNSVEILEDRIKQLENFVYGNNKSCANDDQVVIKSLLESQNRIKTFVNNRQKISNVFKQIDELEKFLCLEYTKKTILSNKAKADIILAEEKLIQQSQENLERISKLTNVLDSEPIKATYGLDAKLNQLSLQHIKQKDTVESFANELKPLFDHYNNIVFLLSKQLSRYSELLFMLERKDSEDA